MRDSSPRAILATLPGSPVPAGARSDGKGQRDRDRADCAQIKIACSFIAHIPLAAAVAFFATGDRPLRDLPGMAVPATIVTAMRGKHDALPTDARHPYLGGMDSREAPRQSRSLTRRGSLAALAGAGALLWAIGPRITGRSVPLDHEPIAGLAPFRRLAVPGGASTTGPASALFVGLDAPGPGPDAALRDALAADPCPALFRGASGAAVPVAYFSDIRCPWCRVVEERLAELSDRIALAIVPHELPVFGESSRLAARAIIAGDALGQGAALRERLRGARAVVDRAYLAHVAGTLGLDPARLFAEMQAPATDRRLAEARALAALFGLSGTPGLVVGRTAISGAVPAETLARVAAGERGAAPCG